ncbi:hypothetical protein DRJ19_03985 [Candidatus Woesearchaeota archaeon]|nr:MAG: hypothetical protein DRJ19_03985 [Candidatus Woesearchaeota archaeon]
MKIFRERAIKFYKEALHDIEEQNFDLAAFHFEQALQLGIKYLLAKELGYFSKTHSLRKLFEELSKIDEKALEFYKENKITLKILEEAYIASRYYYRLYEKDEAEDMKTVVEKFFEKFGIWTL